MKIKQTGIFFAVIYFAASLLTINVVKAQDVKEGYQRSSLHIINIENLNFDNAAKVQASYNKYPFPDKYDDHRISSNSVNLSAYKLTQEEKDALGIKDSELGNALSGALSSATAGILENNSQVKYELDKYIKDKKIAQELVRKWYSIKDDGALDYSVFNERIKLSMSEEDKQRVQQAAIAQTEIDKMSQKLINNTFVVFTKLNFVSNAIPAEAIRQVAYAQADKLSGMLQTIARKAADKIYEKASEGYSVWTSAWLYRLAWNEEKYAEFKTALKLKGDMNSSIDMDLFNKIDFPLEFIGQEKATSLVTFSLKKGEADFMCLNFANPDMVGHTGVYDAVVKAVETVDSCVKQVVETGLPLGFSFIIIADHGNADYVINADGSPNTAHTTNPVPCFLIDNDYKAIKNGKLGDIAPTILKMMGVEIPADMTGEVLG